jgi:hypothetical protein
MIREGWGVVYTKTGAEYGGDWDQETYLAAQAEAQCVSFYSLSSCSSRVLLTVPESGLRGEAYGAVARTSRRPQSIRSEFAWESER